MIRMQRRLNALLQPYLTHRACHKNYVSIYPRPFWCLYMWYTQWTRKDCSRSLKELFTANATSNHSKHVHSQCLQQLSVFLNSEAEHTSQSQWKKRSQRRKHCALAEPKTFAPPQTPFPAARDGQNLISWRWSLPLPINPVWWWSMHAISSYRGNRPTHTHPQTGLITIHCAAASAQCKNYDFYKPP